jgi:hypothetical protein
MYAIVESNGTVTRDVDSLPLARGWARQLLRDRPTTTRWVEVRRQVEGAALAEMPVVARYEAR